MSNWIEIEAEGRKAELINLDTGMIVKVGLEIADLRVTELWQDERVRPQLHISVRLPVGLVPSKVVADRALDRIGPVGGFTTLTLLLGEPFPSLRLGLSI